MNIFRKYDLLVTFLHELLISIHMSLYLSVDLESPLIYYFTHMSQGDKN